LISGVVTRSVAPVLLTLAVLCGGCAWFNGSASQTAAAGVVAGAGDLVEAPAPKPAPRTFTMVAVGDVMLDRTVWKRIQANGVESIFAKVRDDLRSADITFANLECPLSTSGAHAPSDCIFRADPQAVDVLLDGGIDVVTVANNHSLDAGTGGLMQTLDNLDRAGIAYCGAAREREQAWKPCRFEVNGVMLGFVGCTDLSFQHGSWTKIDADLTKFSQHIRDAAQQCDLLVMTVHWGNEYQKVPTRRQRDVAAAAIEAGADLVIGHHPHTLQGVGEYMGAPILYSAGNFVFDQREGERMESAIFRLTWTEGEGWKIRMVPVWIPRTRCGPIYPEASRAAKIIDRLATLSSNLGVPVTVRDNEGEAIIPAAAATTAAGEATPASEEPSSATALDGRRPLPPPEGPT